MKKRVEEEEKLVKPDWYDWGPSTASHIKKAYWQVLEAMGKKDGLLALAVALKNGCILQMDRSK